jgi:hypothetical protein
VHSDCDVADSSSSSCSSSSSSISSSSSSAGERHSFIARVAAMHCGMPLSPPQVSFQPPQFHMLNDQQSSIDLLSCLIFVLLSGSLFFIRVQPIPPNLFTSFLSHVVITRHACRSFAAAVSYHHHHHHNHHHHLQYFILHSTLPALPGPCIFISLLNRQYFSSSSHNIRARRRFILMLLEQPNAFGNACRFFCIAL